MATFDFDLFTIGAGSGGVRASRMSAGYGARVAVAEERHLGGTCVNLGCVPKKLLVYASHFCEEFDQAEGFGWHLEGYKHDWTAFVDRKNQEIARLNSVYEDLLDQSGVIRIQGHARLIAPHTVQVGSKTYTAEHILVATGSWPKLPDIPGVEHAITSNEAFHLPELPSDVILVGGGYIAVEFAGIFNGLGAQTTLIHRGDLLLRGFDQDMRTTLSKDIAKKGVHLHLQTSVARIEKRVDGIRAELSNGDTLEAGFILFATGRTPLCDDVGLEDVGVERSPDGAIVVDAYSKTNIDGIHAIGDVTNRKNLTPIAIAEGMALARTLFQSDPVQPCYANVPTAVFSQPPIATVGCTEEQALQDGIQVDIYRSTFRPLKHALSGSNEMSLMKLIVDSKTDRVLGVHIVGMDAGEMIQGFGVALNCGATKQQFDATVGVHPTSSEELVTMREKLKPKTA